MAKKIEQDRFLIPREFGEYVSEHRKSRGWSLEVVAEKLDVTRSYIGDIELSRRAAPPKEKLLLMAKIYDIDKSKVELSKFLDLAAKTRRDSLPLDVTQFLMNNPKIISFLRKILYREFISSDDVNSMLKDVDIQNDITIHTGNDFR